MCQTFEVSHSKLNILILFLCTLYRLTYHCGALTFIGAENLPLKAPVQVKGLEISETELLVFCLFFFFQRFSDSYQITIDFSYLHNIIYCPR